MRAENFCFKELSSAAAVSATAVVAFLVKIHAGATTTKCVKCKTDLVLCVDCASNQVSRCKNLSLESKVQENLKGDASPINFITVHTKA